MSGAVLRQVFDTLHTAFGDQHWWPANSDYEVIVGAVLTQNTAWRNVQRAIANLRGAGLLEPGAIMALPAGQLAGQIRPAGYFNIKARRLQNLTAALLDDGGVEAWRRWDTDALRRRLLQVNGVGEETADSILLYVFQRPVFVVDAYTRRIFTRLGVLVGDESYGAIADHFHAGLPRDSGLFNEYHALIVRLGNGICRPRPRCGECPLHGDCPVGRASVVGDFAKQ